MQNTFTLAFRSATKFFTKYQVSRRVLIYPLFSALIQKQSKNIFEHNDVVALFMHVKKFWIKNFFICLRKLLSFYEQLSIWESGLSNLLKLWVVRTCCLSCHLSFQYRQLRCHMTHFICRDRDWEMRNPHERYEHNEHCVCNCLKWCFSSVLLVPNSQDQYSYF